ncbi:N-acetylneuraminate (7)9-O-acetyltransferase isoform X2 [Arctopsyche grandis]
MLHRYSQTDTRHCFRYLAFWGRFNHFVFIGDSRVRQLYYSFINHVKVKGEIDVTDTTLQKPNNQSDLSYVDSAKLRLSAEFIWSPYISTKMVNEFNKWKKSDNPPNTIIAGCGITIIREQNASAKALEEYRMNITRLVQPIDVLSGKNTNVLWLLQEPVDSYKLKPDYQVVTNQEIDLYNKAALEMLTHSSAKLWQSSRLVVAGMVSDDGLLLSDTALRHDTQILLNMYCNDHMNFNDGTCCSSAEPYTTLQVLTFSMFFVCMIITVGITLYRWIGWFQRGKGYLPVVNNLNSSPEPDIRDMFSAMSTLGLIVCYFYLCDRTNFFMKENKYYSEWSFWLPVGYVLVLGLFFTEDVRSPKVLNRDQTGEWRGWMQLLVLAAQSTGAAHLLPIHMLMRALNSAYLFLSGYGHFYYIWHTGNTSLVRLFQVLFRLNFMTIILCFTMNRPYQFYHFVPLVSFWFVLLFVVLALPPQVTLHGSDGHPYQYFYLVLKFIGLFVIITVLYMSEVFFQKVFVTRPWKALFVTTDDDIKQWWVNWKQDRYSLTCGAVFAASFLLAQRHGLLDDNSHGNLFSPKVAIGTALVALSVLIGSLTLPFLCTGQQDCDEIHSYIGAIPIVCYVALRNVSGALRSRHSSLLAWFGDISLELFVCQHHIWLAADTHGVLVLIPDAPILNLMLTSFIFVCTAHEVRRLTLVLLPLAVPSDVRKCIRNFFIFVIILIPIGVHDGMF